jgi:hypothetical protein
MRKAVKTGVRPEPRKRKAIRITDITGVAEITVKSGFRKWRARLSKPAAIPAAIPKGTAMAIPPITRTKLSHRAITKRWVGTMATRRSNTGKGPGRIRPEPYILAANSHTRRRNNIPAIDQRVSDAVLNFIELLPADSACHLFTWE